MHLRRLLMTGNKQYFDSDAFGLLIYLLALVTFFIATVLICLTG